VSERPWYKRYPSDFIAGTAGWDLELKGAYSIFLDLFYDRGGSLPNDSQWFGRVAGCSTRRWGQLRNQLIELGKIVVTEDGKLSNKQAEKRMTSEAREARAYRENGAKGGQKAAENRLELFDNNDLAQNQLPENTEHRGRVPEPRSQKESAPPSVDGRARAPAATGTRLPANWQPSDDGAQLAWDLGLNPETVLATFRDYWTSQPGQKGRKTDWEATWRNWCRREAERLSPRGRGPQTQPMLLPIAGGKVPDPNDQWGVEEWCRSIGASEITNPEYLKRGKWMHIGCIIDSIARNVAREAGFSSTWRGDWSPLLRWVEAGCKPSEHIYPAIKSSAEYFRSRGNPATSLNAFNTAVMQRRAA